MDGRQKIRKFENIIGRTGSPGFLKKTEPPLETYRRVRQTVGRCAEVGSGRAASPVSPALARWQELRDADAN